MVNCNFQADPVSNSTDNHYDVTLVGDDRLWDLFNAACRGEPGLRPPELDAGLGCHFQHYGDPYLRLGPFKLEAKNKAPFVAVFRDFMYEAETESYREAAASHLHRSRHFGKGETSNHASVKRTSSQVKKDLLLLVLLKLPLMLLPILLLLPLLFLLLLLLQFGRVLLSARTLQEIFHFLLKTRLKATIVEVKEG